MRSPGRNIPPCPRPPPHDFRESCRRPPHAKVAFQNITGHGPPVRSVSADALTHSPRAPAPTVISATGRRSFRFRRRAPNFRQRPHEWAVHQRLRPDYAACGKPSRVVAPAGAAIQRRHGHAQTAVRRAVAVKAGGTLSPHKSPSQFRFSWFHFSPPMPQVDFRSRRGPRPKSAECPPTTFSPSGRHVWRP